MDQNGHFSQFCPFFELQWVLIFFLFTYSMPVGQKLLIEKIIENIFFMKINILAFLAKNPHSEGLVPYPYQQNGSSGFKYMCSSEVQKTFSVRNYSQKKFLEKKFFTKINIFGIFGPKTEKMGCARKWFFFQFCPFFFIESKSIENTKKLSPQMIKVW